MSVAAGAALALAGAGTVGASADNSASWVTLWNARGSAQVAGSTSTLVRSQHGVFMTVHAVGLEAGQPASVTWFVFNHPEFCVTGRQPVSACSPGDLKNPKVGAAVVPGPTATVRPNGTVFFAGGLRTGTALTNPKGAEILLLVRVHGTAKQFAVHKPGSSSNGEHHSGSEGEYELDD